MTRVFIQTGLQREATTTLLLFMMKEGNCLSKSAVSPTWPHPRRIIRDWKRQVPPVVWEFDGLWNTDVLESVHGMVLFMFPERDQWVCYLPSDHCVWISSSRSSLSFHNACCSAVSIPEDKRFVIAGLLSYIDRSTDLILSDSSGMQSQFRTKLYHFLDMEISFGFFLI